MEILKAVPFENYVVVRLSNYSIAVYHNGEELPEAKPILRWIANKLDVSLLNGSGMKHNTRTLGKNVIDAIAKNNKSH